MAYAFTIILFDCKLTPFKVTVIPAIPDCAFLTLNEFINNALLMFTEEIGISITQLPSDDA